MSKIKDKKMNNETQSFINNAMSALREILSDTDIEIAVDYNDNEDGSVRDIIFNLMFDGVTEYEVEFTENDITYRQIEKVLMSVLENIKTQITLKGFCDDEKVILSEETDAWYGTHCRTVIGAYKSKLLALVDFMLSTNEIINEEAGGYKSVRESIYKIPSFEGLYLTELIVNERA